MSDARGAESESAHPLVVMLREAAMGRFPPADGSIRVVGSPPGRSDAVVAFTAHHVIAVPLPEDEVQARHRSVQPRLGLRERPGPRAGTIR